MKATLSALFICIAAAALEGALAGRGVRQRLAALRVPPYSPPFAVWVLIGGLYYSICFIVLRHLLAVTPAALPLQKVAVGLLIFVLLGNALWSVLFFRRRDLRLSFLAFIPYAAVVMALVLVLMRSYPFGAMLFLGYGLYLLYASWWGYHVWLLNGQQTWSRD